MATINHATCGTPLVWQRRAATPEQDNPGLDLWCPECRAFVGRPDWSDPRAIVAAGYADAAPARETA